jgi:transcriptional regulator GlxA family with amidase domain
VFKNVTGLTPSRYLERLRMKEAYTILHRHPDMPVSSVALACGYTNISSFGRAFRRTWGRSPSELREMLSSHDVVK